MFIKSNKIITSWNNIPYGKYYLIALNKKLQSWWPKIFGYYLLKIGRFSAQIDTKSSLISNQISIHTHGDNFQLHGNLYKMPINNKSIDACLLMQELSYSHDPYLLLKEIDRILIDDGWLIFSNFNSISLLGIGKCFPFLRNKEPYKNKMFSVWHQLHWLKLLNYQLLDYESFQLIPKLNPNSIINTNLKFGGCIHLFIARKRTLPLNKISFYNFQKKLKTIFNTYNTN